MFEYKDSSQHEKTNVGALLFGLGLCVAWAVTFEPPLWIASLLSGVIGVTINESINYFARKKKNKMKESVATHTKKERHLKLIQK